MEYAKLSEKRGPLELIAPRNHWLFRRVHSTFSQFCMCQCRLPVDDSVTTLATNFFQGNALGKLFRFLFLQVSAFYCGLAWRLPSPCLRFCLLSSWAAFPHLPRQVWFGTQVRTFMVSCSLLLVCVWIVKNCSLQLMAVIDVCIYLTSICFLPGLLFYAPVLLVNRPPSFLVFFGYPALLLPSSHLVPAIIFLGAEIYGPYVRLPHFQLHLKIWIHETLP